jgi:hypothetical protein
MAVVCLPVTVVVVQYTRGTLVLATEVDGKRLALGKAQLTCFKNCSVSSGMEK